MSFVESELRQDQERRALSRERFLRLQRAGGEGRIQRDPARFRHAIECLPHAKRGVGNREGLVDEIGERDTLALAERMMRRHQHAMPKLAVRMHLDVGAFGQIETETDVGLTAA